MKFLFPLQRRTLEKENFGKRTRKWLMQREPFADRIISERYCFEPPYFLPPSLEKVNVPLRVKTEQC